METETELIPLLNRKTFEHDHVKKEIKERKQYFSREKLLILRRLKRNLWHEIKELKREIELLQK